MIINCPDQSNGTYEGDAHRKAKVRVAETLSAAGYEVEYELPVIVGGITYFLDIHLPKHDIAIEIDGRRHRSRLRKWRDRMKDEAVATRGKQVIRIEIADALDYPESILPKLPSLIG